MTRSVVVHAVAEQAAAAQTMDLAEVDLVSVVAAAGLSEALSGQSA